MPPQRWLLPILLLLPLVFAVDCEDSRETVERPPRVVSMRKKVFDAKTYEQLADAWHIYYKAYPSEDAYANWMYALKYTKEPKFRELLHKGVKKYPGNPTLLYLEGVMASAYQEPGFGIEEMEKSASLDSSYDDPWYGLATSYMTVGEMEKFDQALQRLLELGAINEETMDFSYNMFALLDSNAILLTNGDNDTYPGWALTRVVKYRPDVAIVNRSLLETEWYPDLLMKQGMPQFLEEGELQRIRAELPRKEEGPKPSNYIPVVVSDSLIMRIIQAAEPAGRPVYLASTFAETPALKKLITDGVCLGLVFKVSPVVEDRAELARRAFKTWLNDFRTSGLDSWQLRYVKPEDSGRMLSRNYLLGVIWLLKNLPDAEAESLRPEASDWCERHLTFLKDDQYLTPVMKMLTSGEEPLK